MRARGVWFWWIVGTLVSVLLLWGGTQVAIGRGQSVDWYSAFGQWLGALGSLIAAGAALWIATTDRRRADDQRQAQRDEEDEDLAREAGLVRVEIAELRVPNAVTPADTAPGISVTNWRRSPVFDLRLERVVVQGETIEEPEFRRCGVHSDDAVKMIHGADHLSRRVIATRTIVTLFPTRSSDALVEYAALRYTDETGRRWEIDSASRLARKVR